MKPGTHHLPGRDRRGVLLGLLMDCVPLANHPIAGTMANMTHDSGYTGPTELGVSDETALTALGRSGQRYIVTIQRPSVKNVSIKFTGLFESEEGDEALLDALLLRALKRAFSVEAVDEVILSGDGNAERLFHGLAPVDQKYGYAQCHLSRHRYLSFFKS